MLKFNSFPKINIDLIKNGNFIFDYTTKFSFYNKQNKQLHILFYMIMEFEKCRKELIKIKNIYTYIII